MFVTGLVVSYILLFLVLYCGKYIGQRFDKCIGKAQEMFCAFIFTMVTYLMTLLYTYLTFVTENILVGAFVCTLFLLISWMLTEKLYYTMVGNFAILTGNDKNFCHLISIAGIVISSLIMGWENSETEYAIIISCAISVLIGAYVPITEIYADKNIRDLWIVFVCNFKEAKTTVKVTGVICLVFTAVIVSAEEFAIKMQSFIHSFGTGMAVGTFSMLGILVGIAIVKDMAKKTS